MKARKPIGLALAVAATVALGIGVTYLVLAGYEWRLLKECMKARPIDMQVDLSQPGEYVTHFTKPYPYDGYGCDLLLIVPPDAYPASSRIDLLAGLEGHCSITNPDGIEQIPQPEMQKLLPEIVHGVFDRPICLHSIRSPLHRGPYVFKLTISHGAPTLAGVDQRLRMKYLIDFESIVPFMMLGIAVVTLALGISMGFIASKLTRSNPGNVSKDDSVAAV